MSSEEVRERVADKARKRRAADAAADAARAEQAARAAAMRIASAGSHQNNLPATLCSCTRTSERHLYILPPALQHLGDAV